MFHSSRKGVKAVKHGHVRVPYSPVELEGVGAVAMRRVLLQVLGKVDDHNGIKRAFLHAKWCAGARVVDGWGQMETASADMTWHPPNPFMRCPAFPMRDPPP